jgi:simple sugar transport system permease protein
MTEALVPILIATLAAGTPLVFAALGELVVEKSGVLNLGVEGMMLCGAIAGFAATVATGSVWMGVLAGMAAGAATSLVFAVLTLTLQANQVAAGLALSIFGVGLSAFVGKPFESVALPAPRRSTSRACRTSRCSGRSSSRTRRSCTCPGPCSAG